MAADKTALEQQAAAHYAELMRDALQIETPDEEVNRALAWSEIALDQAWVCDPDLGCGLVAGYGPSRNARRPQYAWFFAGDGLIATDGLVAAGEYDRARAELEFILKYQDRKTGMIWHELSQSAGHIDWAGKYPYMFVHVDITFQFLSALSRYVEASGDIDFAKQHWSAIESAYRYCQSVIDPATNLPRIPPDKEGGNEQDRESDESEPLCRMARCFFGIRKACRMDFPSAGRGAGQARHRARACIDCRAILGQRTAVLDQRSHGRRERDIR